VAAFDPRQVHEARAASDQRAAREGELGHRLQASFVDRTRTVGDPLAPRERIANRRMRLEALELVVRRQMRVRVIEMNDEPDGDQVLAVVIEERATADVAGQRPA
jgi:hypothetical protein